MKKLLVVLSLLVFVGVYAAPALTMSPDMAAKIVAVDKDKKAKKTSKAEATKSEAGKSEAKASCCEAGKAEMKSGCAASCKEASSCKGEGMKATEEKKK